MMEQEFSKTLKDLNLQLFKVIGKRHKKLGVNLTPIWGTIILTISNSKEALCQKHLETFVSCNKSTLSSILDTMEKKDLIERIPDASDTRKKVIVLTENSKKLVKRIKEEKAAIDKEMLQGISDEELDAFQKTLNKMFENLERM